VNGRVGSPSSAVLLPALGEPTSSLSGLAARLRAAGWVSETIGRQSRRNLADHVADLRLAWGRCSTPAPRLLIGASYGGMVAASFAKGIDASELAGVVLLDVPHPLSHRAITAAVGRRAEVELPNPEGVDLAAALTAMAEVEIPGSLGRLPLLVLSRGVNTWPGRDADLPMADRVWLAHQRLHTLMSADATFSTLHGVGHDMAQTHPAAVVDEVMRWWVDSSRSETTAHPTSTAPGDILAPTPRGLR